MPVTIHYEDGSVKRIEGKLRKVRSTFVGPPKPYPWPPKPKEPTWPQYAGLSTYRVIKKEDGYHLQKKGWFLWSTIMVPNGEAWFIPLYAKGIYRDWEAAMKRMEWESKYGR